MIEVIVLVLASITLLLVSVVVLLVLGFRKSVEIDRLKQILQGTVKKLGVPSDTCQHSFGYLNSYAKGKPIPPECMVCSDIFECMANKKEGKNSRD